MSQIDIRTDNVDCVHHDDLIDKLRMAQHDSIRDKVAEIIIMQEIEKRKARGNWK